MLPFWLVQEWGKVTARYHNQQGMLVNNTFTSGLLRLSFLWPRICAVCLFSLSSFPFIFYLLPPSLQLCSVCLQVFLTLNGQWDAQHNFALHRTAAVYLMYFDWDGCMFKDFVKTFSSPKTLVCGKQNKNPELIFL